MFEKLNKVIQNQILNFEISNDRKIILQPLIDYIQQKIVSKEDINLNFICTHNSRRSHLAQIWAKTAASYYTIKNVQSYSGGTKVTALFPKIIETLNNQGFEISIISETSNPVYAIKYDENTIPIIGFSKRYDHPFNPVSQFAAIMTCSQVENDCPLIFGPEKSFSLYYEDPKISDGTDIQSQIYETRSLEIAREIFYIFNKIKT